MNLIPGGDKQQFLNLLNAGQFDGALLMANQLSVSHPEDPEGYTMTGDAFKFKADFDTAITFYAMSLMKQPQQPRVLSVMAQCYQKIGKTAEAYQYFLQSYELAPDDAYILYNLGQFLVQRGETEEARLTFEQALSLGDLRAAGGLIDLYIYTHDNESLLKLMEQYRSVLGNNNLSLARAFIYLKDYTGAAEYLSQMQTQTKDLPWRKSWHYLYAQSLEKQGLYERAFQQMQAQNNLGSRQYKSLEVESLGEAVRIETTKLHANTLSNLNHKHIRPLFILGAPRSGSSLLEQIINTSPQVCIAGELMHIEAAFKACIKGEQSMQEAANWYLNKLAGYLPQYQSDNTQTQPIFITDKLPGNFLYIGFIQKLLPTAKIIVTQRNPMDTGLSIYRQIFSDGVAYATSLESIGHYLNFIQDLVEYWKTQSADELLIVEYEQVISDFEQQTKKVFAYLELAWDESVNSFYRSSDNTRTASHDQVRQPLYRSSIDAWKRYEKELQPLKAALKNGLMMHPG